MGEPLQDSLLTRPGGSWEAGSAAAVPGVLADHGLPLARRSRSPSCDGCANDRQTSEGGTDGRATHSSGERSAPTVAPASPRTSGSAREPPTPTIPGTGSTTATTQACRSTAGLPIRHGRTTPTAPATTPTARCTSWTSTPRQCPRHNSPSGLHPAGKGRIQCGRGS